VSNEDPNTIGDDVGEPQNAPTKPEIQEEPTAIEGDILPSVETREEARLATAAESTSMLAGESTPIEEIEEIPRVPPSVQREEPPMAEVDFCIGYYNPNDRTEPPTKFDLVFHAAEAKNNIQELRNIMKRAAEYTEVSNFHKIQATFVARSTFL